MTTSSPFFQAAGLYLRIFLGVLALAGILGLVSMQSGWLVPAGSLQAHARLAQADDGEVVRVPRPASRWSPFVPVDTSLVYDISAQVRAIDPAGGQITPTRTYLGVMAFDGDRQPLGRNRYSGARDYALRPVQGWVTLTGTMTGEGEGDEQFPPGTRFVRVVALLNYHTEDMTSEVRNMRFAPRLAIGRRE